MPFEQKPRIKFNKNPLIEVICKFNFISPIDGMDNTDLLVQLHDSIKKKLPLFKKAKSLTVELNTDNQTVGKSEGVVYEFSSLDESVQVMVESDSITCATSNYQSKEEFFDYFLCVYNNLQRLYSVNLISKVGLRYKDVIQRSVLNDNLTDVGWHELIKEPLVAVFADEDLSASILGVQSGFTIKLDGIGKNARMNANYGIVSHAETKEQCFLIDSDFYIDGVFDYDTAEKFLYNANAKARDFFQWCIKPRLYEALDPEALCSR